MNTSYRNDPAYREHGAVICACVAIIAILFVGAVTIGQMLLQQLN